MKAADTPRLQSERAWVTFCQAALMDCFAADKPAMLPAYMTMHAMRARTPEESDTTTAGLNDIVRLQAWYRRIKMLRIPLIRNQVIKSVFLVCTGKLDALRQSPVFMGHLRDYLNGRPVNEAGDQSRRVIRRQLAFYLTASETPPLSTLATLKMLYVETVQSAVAKGLTPDSLRSALMMVMKETVLKALNVDWQWDAILDVIVCWMRG
jgi:Anaphase-promoting complex sub unit 1 C-terminal domain